HGPGLVQGSRLWLHTSPEFAMKRLLAAGSGSIYQIARVFRDGESGARHNPEFTLLEWYRVDFDHFQLMDEVAELVRVVLAGHRQPGPVERLSYRQAFRRYLDLDPFAPVTALRDRAGELGIAVAGELSADDPDPWRDLLLTHAVEPQLGRGRLTFLHDYPASQAALARVRPGDPPLAERFELYMDGVELANGFHELGDPLEQRSRFEADNALRRRQGLTEVPVDQNLLGALAEGLPDCAGVALGLDRLFMIAAGVERLEEVLAFPLERA
ncbi:MAG: EF-P lysine aminoacylase EpmA, partial [Candidatus Competibacteraceae bacterium]|nr:EF-P lysine aminoacylase EpmA [Candidatus Competibacteraceae bacterium]